MPEPLTLPHPLTFLEQFEEETWIDPMMIARQVTAEVAGRIPGPSRWTRAEKALVRKTVRVFFRSPQVQADLLRPWTAREALRSYMRHWLSGWILEHLGTKPFRALPPGFCFGIAPGGEVPIDIPYVLRHPEALKS